MLLRLRVEETGYPHRMTSVLGTVGPDIGFTDEIARLLLVAVLAGGVGIERELREQEAGLRTHMLVGVGAALFVLAGTYSWSGFEFGNRVGIVLDPSRVIAYVVTGVGFLGAGAIMKNGEGVRGLTTAASLWVVAAVGVTVASGQYLLGIFATTVVLMSLWPVKHVARKLGIRRQRLKRIVVNLAPGSSVGEIVSAVERPGLELQATTVTGTNGTRQLEVVVAGWEDDVLLALDHLSEAQGVTAASLIT